MNRMMSGREFLEVWGMLSNNFIVVYFSDYEFWYLVWVLIIGGERFFWL